MNGRLLIILERSPRPLRRAGFVWLTVLAEQIGLGRFVHRTASNVQDEDAVFFDSEEGSVWTRAMPVKELINRLVD